MRSVKAIVLLWTLAACAPVFGQTDKWREVDVSANPHSNYAAQQRTYLPVQDCHYVTEQYTVQVRDGRFESDCVAPCTQTVYDACGRPCSTRTTPGYCVRRWVPPQYETVRYRAYRSDLEIRTLGPDPCVTIGWAPSTARDQVDYPTMYRYRYDPRIRSERTVRRNNRGSHTLSAVADRWR
jgi:hypothetical protein